MKKIVLIGMVIVGGLVASCKPDDAAVQPSTVETGTAKLHLHTYIGEEEVDLYNVVYRDVNNRKISLSFSQLYLSDVELVKYDGSIYDIGDSLLLTDISNQVYSLGKVPVGNYKSIRFKVGLPASINAQVPTGSGILNNADMWFLTTPQANNYVFMKCVGKIDTTSTASADDVDMVPFQYLIGTNAHLTQVSMPVQNYAVQPNTTTYIHMKADYSELFEGVDLLDETNLTVATTADNASSLAIDIAANISKMFKYEN